MKRTLTMTTGVGAACENSWIIANCDAPAKTRRLIATISSGCSPLGLASAWRRLELPDLTVDASPDDAIARGGRGRGSVDDPAMRLVDRGDTMAGVGVWTVARETDGALALSFAKGDRRRAAFADPPRAGRGPWILRPTRARRDRRRGDGVCLVRRRTGLG